MAILSLLLGITTVVLLLTGLLDLWAWPTTLLVMTVVAGQSALLFARCPQCGKSLFAGPSRTAVVGQVPVAGRRRLLPERECSDCHHRHACD